jgi:hypothetical protein
MRFAVAASGSWKARSMVMAAISIVSGSWGKKASKKRIT